MPVNIWSDVPSSFHWLLLLVPLEGVLWPVVPTTPVHESVPQISACRPQPQASSAVPFFLVAAERIDPHGYPSVHSAVPWWPNWFKLSPADFNTAF